MPINRMGIQLYVKASLVDTLKLGVFRRRIEVSPVTLIKPLEAVGGQIFKMGRKHVIRRVRFGQLYRAS